MYGLNYDKIKLEEDVKDMVCKDFKFFQFLINEICDFYDEEGQVKDKFRGRSYCKRYMNSEYVRYEVSFRDNPITNDLEIKFMSGVFHESAPRFYTKQLDDIKMEGVNNVN